MKAFQFHPQAAADLAGTVARYEQQQRGLGLDFCDALERAIREACEAPERWPKIQGAVRRIISRTFPCAILYTLHADAIWVLALMPLRRNPAVPAASVK